MKAVETKNGKHQIKFYDSIRQLPMRRYQKFNKFMMIASQVGESIEDYDMRTQRAIQYLNANDIKNAGIELENRRQNVHHALSEYSPKGMALAIMVYSIDGNLYENYDDETLNSVIDELDKIGFDIEQVNEVVSEVKKK